MTDLSWVCAYTKLILLWHFEISDDSTDVVQLSLSADKLIYLYYTISIVLIELLLE